MSLLYVFLFVLIGDHHVRAAGLQVHLVRLRMKIQIKEDKRQTVDAQPTTIKLWI